MSVEPEEAKESLDMLRGFGGEDLVRSLLGKFLKFADQQMAAAAAAAEAGEAAGIGRAAHAVKSSARQLGAFALGDICERTETAAVDHQDLAAAVAGLAEMRAELANARRWMQAMIDAGN